MKWEKEMSNGIKREREGGGGGEGGRRRGWAFIKSGLRRGKATEKEREREREREAKEEGTRKKSKRTKQNSSWTVCGGCGKRKNSEKKRKNHLF